jgi:hypothetical protein
MPFNHGWTRITQQIQLSWPGWATAYSAYAGSNLIPPQQWSPITNVPQTDAGNFNLLLPLARDQGFFPAQRPVGVHSNLRLVHGLGSVICREGLRRAAEALNHENGCAKQDRGADQVRQCGHEGQQTGGKNWAQDPGEAARALGDADVGSLFMRRS